MRKIIKLSLLSIILFITSCSKSDDNITEPNINDDINYFIWKGMNAFYFWQKDVPNLANNRFSNLNELYTHFRDYSSPENSFNSLIYQKDISDRFSWIVDDYVALENSFQGINQSTGMEFGLIRYSNNNKNVLYAENISKHPNRNTHIKERINRSPLIIKIDETISLILVSLFLFSTIYLAA